MKQGIPLLPPPTPPTPVTVRTQHLSSPYALGRTRNSGHSGDEPERQELQIKGKILYKITEM